MVGALWPVQYLGLNHGFKLIKNEFLNARDQKLGLYFIVKNVKARPRCCWQRELDKFVVSENNYILFGINGVLIRIRYISAGNLFPQWMMKIVGSWMTQLIPAIYNFISNFPTMWLIVTHFVIPIAFAKVNLSQKSVLTARALEYAKNRLRVSPTKSLWLLTAQTGRFITLLFELLTLFWTYIQRRNFMNSLETKLELLLRKIFELF